MNVIYCRVAQKSNEAIQYQKFACSEFLEAQNIKPDLIYIDDGFSGLNEERPELNKIIQELDNIETITVNSVDRIYRESVKLLKFYQLLKSKNIKLYDVRLGEDIISSTNNRLFEIIEK